VQNIGLNGREVAASVMRLNPLGATNLMVSRLGLGMAALGRPGYINLGQGEDLGDRDRPRPSLLRRWYQVTSSKSKRCSRARGHDR
jgi:hypothetical protein